MEDGSFTFRGKLEGHAGWVTQIATTEKNEGIILSASRDRTVLVWQLQDTAESCGFALRSLKGHSHTVSDVVISSDGQFALSGSWDHTLRLWEISTGVCKRRFVGHEKDVLSVAFSPDNRQVVSASRDGTIRLWNVLAECKFVIQNDESKDSSLNWVSCVRFSPDTSDPVIVSCGWDNKVKVWNLSNCKLKCNNIGHTGYLNSVTVSPDGSLCASGGQDQSIMLWDLTENSHLYTIDAKDMVNALAFSPSRYWICAAAGSSIKIYDLESKDIVHELVDDSVESGKAPTCLSLAWSADGQTLFAGYSDNAIRVWKLH